jgi:hypothetical protein
LQDSPRAVPETIAETFEISLGTRRNALDACPVHSGHIVKTTVMQAEQHEPRIETCRWRDGRSGERRLTNQRRIA